MTSSILKDGIPVALDGGRPGDFIRIEAEEGVIQWAGTILPSTEVVSVELFYRPGTPRLQDRIYPLAEGRESEPGDWGFVEIGYNSDEEIVEARLTREVKDAPSFLSFGVACKSDPIVYDEQTYRRYDWGESDGYLITREGSKSNGESTYVVFHNDRSTGNLPCVLIYAWWKGGSGVYWGYSVPIEFVSLYIPATEEVEEGSTD